MYAAEASTGVTAMLDNVTISKLHDLKLKAMARLLQDQQGNPSIGSLSFEERLGLLVEAEWLSRRDGRTARHIRQAGFRFSAVIEDISYQGKQGISKDDIHRLSSGGYIRKNQNVILTGPTGVGKTYIACALGRTACLQGIGTRYMRVADLQLEMAAARYNGKYPALQKELARIPLLILDDLGIKQFTVDESHDMLEVAEARYQKGSTIFAGQLPSAKWHELFPDPTLADAILDRVVHNAYKFNITGETMRKTLAMRDFE